MKSRIVRLREDEDQYLSLAGDWKKSAADFYADEILEDPATGLDAHAVADVLSCDAENANHHGLVGQYEKLAQICVDESNEEVALRIMNKIAEMGGLIE